jgi:hypothetical protein
VRKTAASCAITLMIVNVPTSPEFLNFRALVAKGIEPETRVLTGFSLDVANFKFSQGQPSGADVTQLAKAAFVSKSFNSAGRLFDTDYKDGGIGATTTDESNGEARRCPRRIWGNEWSPPQRLAAYRDRALCRLGDRRRLEEDRR